VSLLPSYLTESLLTSASTKNKKIFSPTNKLSYGRIPAAPAFKVAAGEIYLRLGFVGVGRSKSGAFGARHIWDKHKGDLNIKEPSDIPKVVASILRNGADVLVDKSKSADRPLVLNSNIGIVILQPKKTAEGGIEYSIVSAYGRRNHKGTVIGQLLHT
jgi:hypothetical protein